MTSAPRLLVQAVTAGVVTAREAHDGVVGIRPQPRSNNVHRIECRGEPVAYVKQAGTASLLDGDDTVAVEAEVLRALDGWGVAPSLAVDSQSGAVWTRPARGVELASLAGQGASDLGRVLGSALRRWHDASASVTARPAPLPWPLREELLPSMETVPQSDELEQVLDLAYAAHVRRVVATLRSGWARRPVLVHGDLSVHNIFVELASEAHSAPTVTFIDVEAAGLGDAGWDLACVEAAVSDLNGPTEQVPWAPGVRAAYDNPFVGRVAEWAMVRALVSAWQVAAHPESHVRALTSTYLARAERALEES